MTSKQKAEAWKLAADVLSETTMWLNKSQTVVDYVHTNVIPSLRRRADIIRRNAPKRVR